MRLGANAALLVGISLTVVSTLPVSTAAPDELIDQRWEVAQIEGAKVGYLHTTTRRLESDGSKCFRTTAELELTFKRHTATIRLRREQGTEETPDGQTIGVFMRQGQEGGRQLVLTGSLEEGRMHVRIDNGRIERRLTWSEDVVGLRRLEQLFAERKPKPGDQWDLKRYDPTYNAVVTYHVAVKEPQEVVLLPGMPRAKLLRVEWSAEPLEAPGIKVQPPPEVWWLDERFVPARRQFELDGLGTVVLIRTTKEAATKPAAGRVADIGLKTLLPLNRSLTRPYSTTSLVYRVTLRGDADPATALVSDDHQEIRHVQGDTFELHVHPARRPPRAPEAATVSDEYLESCHFIDCADARIKELAKRATGTEKDPWAKTRRLERWVKQSMRPDNTAALGPASEVARLLRGDCRQYALLTAALCRAEGIPSRVVVGLLYIEKDRRPCLGFHMWTEVWIDGRWLGLDATLGLGGVSAAHLKIADHSWHETQSLTPLLPANRVLGKMTIHVLDSEP